LSNVFASSQAAPAVIVRALAADQADVARPLLERSPLLRDADLVDLVASGNADAQIAIASRFPLGRPVAAAIAEVGAAAACLAVLENPDAELATFSLDRIVERFGHLAVIRENLLARDDLPAVTRQALLAKLSQTLAGFVAARQWLPQDHAEDAARQACEKATVVLAAGVPVDEVPALVSYLRSSGQLTAGLVLRALLSGNVVLFEEALADLSGLPIDAVVNLIHDRTIAGFRALYRKAQLPELAYPAFREAVVALREDILVTERCNGSQLNRRMVEHVLDRCADDIGQAVSPLVALLQRYSVEAAREEARMFCQDLVAEPFEQPRLVA
jgi:uncharacterized protein (DUF2336 family)